MNINEILNGSTTNLSIDEQKSVLEQMKELKIFELDETKRKNLIDFLCDKSDSKLAIDYLFHVLDTEISYPIDDEKVKSLFSDERMKKMKDLMMEQLQDEPIEGEDEKMEEVQTDEDGEDGEDEEVEV
jgi:hypothetical protein